MRRARLDLCLVLANKRVLFGLVMTRPSHASDGAIIDCLGAVGGRQGATVDRLGAIIDRPGAVGDRQGATINRTGATTDCMSAAANRRGPTGDRQGAPVTVRVPPPTVQVPLPTTEKALTIRGVDREDHRSRCLDLHACPTVGANYRGL
jgi:hypothetical protein